MWRERLQLSHEEFGVITTADVNGVRFRFGDPSTFAGFLVEDFIRLAGITREQLDELLALRFNPDLANIVVSKK